MNPKIEFTPESDDVLKFTLNGVNVCYANAIRRTILSDIPVVVFKTTPYAENKANITVNTTRLNNEIIKQRLSSIPICITDLDMPFNNYQLEVNEDNKTDTIMVVTTQHFKIRNLTNDTLLDDADVRKIFPPYVPSTGKGEYFIEFVRLRPKISDEIIGEKIAFTSTFSTSTAREDAMFNVTGTCGYGFTPDINKMNEEVAKRIQKWTDEGKNKDEVAFEAKNWKLLEGLRYVIKDSFDFTLQSVGIYDNRSIVVKACNILIIRLDNLIRLTNEDAVKIEPSQSTMENCYDVTLENEDYTIGNMLNHQIYEIFYRDMEKVSYVGFKKFHPHDVNSVLRFAFKDIVEKKSAKTLFKLSLEGSKEVIEKIRGLFDGKRKK
jgi:DNA-directed RNA polymerase subunit L